MTNESVTIILPLPPRVLSPNCPIASMRGRFMKAAAAKKQRRLAKEAVEAEEIESVPWDNADLQAVFFHKTKRRRDGVNHNQMLKSAQDGIVDSGLLIDDDAEHLTTLPPKFEIDKECPRVEITIIKRSPA